MLRDDGLYLLNVVDEPPWERATAQIRQLKEAFGGVLRFGDRSVVSTRRAGNVLLAAAADLSEERLSRALAGGRFPGVVQTV